MEGDETGVEVEAGSPPATENGQPTAQAPVQPAQPAAPPEPPFHQHPRFQELIRDRNMSRQTIAQLQQEMEGYKQKFADLERKSSQGNQTPEEELQMQQARSALERIIMSDEKMLDRLLSTNP